MKALKSLKNFEQEGLDKSQMYSVSGGAAPSEVMSTQTRCKNTAVNVTTADGRMCQHRSDYLDGSFGPWSSFQYE